MGKGEMKEGEKDFIQRFETLVFKPDCMKGRCLGRLYDNISTIMVNKTLIDALKKADIKGLEYIRLQDEVNRMYWHNYKMDMQTLKY